MGREFWLLCPVRWGGWSVGSLWLGRCNFTVCVCVCGGASQEPDNGLNQGRVSNEGGEKKTSNSWNMPLSRVCPSVQPITPEATQTSPLGTLISFVIPWFRLGASKVRQKCIYLKKTLIDNTVRLSIVNLVTFGYMYKNKLSFWINSDKFQLLNLND